MFSPSLAAMLFQSIAQDVLSERQRKESTHIGGDSGLSAMASRLVSFPWAPLELTPIDFEWETWTALGPAPLEWSRLPVVGRVASDIELGAFREYITSDRAEGFVYLWGRVPVDVLANSFAEVRDEPADRYYLDLGTPLRTEGSGTRYDKDCYRDLQLTAPNPGSAKCGVAIIDLGQDPKHGLDDYNRRLRHTVTGNIELSEHAEKVLSILLARLGTLLPDTTVSCALVRRPATAIASGKGCFDQATSVELCDAVLALEPQLNSDNLPAAINISLGTHVGPHNGDSPLEEYIATKLCRPRDRFVVVAAGNDGGSGLAAKRELSAGSRDYLKILTGRRCQDLLVEFWWYEPVASTVFVEVDVFELIATGGRAHRGTARIRSGKSGNILNLVRMGLPSSFIAQALFHSRCRNDLSCLAFSISGTSGAMPALEIEFALESTVDVTVNAWIVVCEPQPQTTFVEGGADGTVRVPASDPHVISVAGNDSYGQQWVNSSRGPSAIYGGGPKEGAPLMSHLVSLSSESGTSFSSPRACGDLLKAIADPSKLPNCNDATDLICEAYGLTRSTLIWNGRSGYHKVTV